MAKVNTGMQRGIELTVTKTVGGVSVNGYPRVYRLTESFGESSAKTATELAEMSVDDYKARVGAFKLYIESVEPGVSVNTSAAYIQNTSSCPIGK